MRQSMHGSNASNPAVWLVGDVAHGDFADVVALLQSSANVGPGEPELIVVVESRQGLFRDRDLARLRRSAPLASVVSLLGSWCEGQTRSGRPLADTKRLYWYEFSSWWRRQLQLRHEGQCPEWAQTGYEQRRSPRNGLDAAHVAIAAIDFDTVAAIGDVVRSATGQFTWWRENHPVDTKSILHAGVWVGGQLSDTEAGRLAKFCDDMAQHHAPVIALLDFPRRDRIQAARSAGAVSVLGMPWRNEELIEELRQVMSDSKWSRAIQVTRAA